MKKSGKVYLIGAGPGDPGLITLKGYRLLKVCDAVVYDHLASQALLDWTRADCRRIFAGKETGRHSMKQQEINEILLSLAGQGMMVVRLKGGDPFVFGRGGEEALALEQARIPYELVPGVTSAVAVPECAGIPVTHREVSRSFHVITGHTQGDNDCLPPGFELYGTLPGTLVFLMGLNQLPLITKRLMESGKPRDTPAAVIEKGTLPGQRTVRATLGNLEAKVKEADIQTPAVIVVGHTAACNLRCSLGRPLEGIHVGITGTRHFSEKLSAALEAKGASTSWICAMDLRSREELPPMKDAYRQLDDYTWIIFTSANGVSLFFRGLRKAGRDYRALGRIKFAVIGPGTGDKLKAQGFCPDYMPEEHCAFSLGRGLAPLLTAKDRVLIPRSLGGSGELTRELSGSKAVLHDIVLYETEGRDRIITGETGCYDYLVFASASGVRAFFESSHLSAHACLSGQIPENAPKLACIGQITASALESYGYKAQVTAETYDIPGLTAAMEADVNSGNTL